MALFNWLFKKSKLRPAPDQWIPSENGNPTLISGSTRITVFRQDRGYKYCIADIDDRKEPYFSEKYANEHEAQEEALAYIRGEPAHHQPIEASYTADRRDRWQSLIRERSKLIKELQSYLAENPDIGITALRKPEKKIASHLKQLHWQISEYQLAGVSASLTSLAEQQKHDLIILAEEVATRINVKQAMRPPKKAPVSNSQLPPELANKVDDLIRLFIDCPVMSDKERDRRYRESSRAATERMLADNITYGQASGAPDFLNQNEKSFRAFMKKADQDLAWQCETVTEAFERFRRTGDIPAPHYPMRIAILLRKAKDFNREKLFLVAWCKHFQSGNGTTYLKLVERATKVGAILD